MHQVKLTPQAIGAALRAHTPIPDGATFGHFAVMALLFEENGELSLLFCKRALTLAHQPGDICFPGGRAEGNETPLETALRETEEEIGIKAENIELLGEPDFVVTLYHAYVRPFVGFAKGIRLQDVVFNPDEVDKVFTVPLRFFMEEKPLTTYVGYEPVFPKDFPFHMIVGGTSYGWGTPKQKQYFYQYDGEIIWGLTARIARNICSILQK